MGGWLGGGGVKWEHIKYLDDEVADDSAVVGVHAWAKGVEYARHTHLYVRLALVGVHHGLRHALALVIARTRPDGVHVSPVRLLLRVHLGVAVHLGCARQQHSRLQP